MRLYKEISELKLRITINPKDCCDYLESIGYHSIERTKDLLAVSNELGHVVHIPVKKEYRDYVPRLIVFMEQLGDYLGVGSYDVYEGIMNVVRMRVLKEKEEKE